MNKNFSNQAKWIQTPENSKIDLPYVKGIPLRPVGDNKIQYEINTGTQTIKLQILNDKAFLMSNGKTFDDMCNMDILNQPQVLNNLVQRYRQDKIFTLIGPTLIVVNPYRVLPQYFSKEEMLRLKNKILQGSVQNQNPHIYLIAGNAFNSMIDQEKKQAIVISGESGAGKTQSTKYCMQLLTSLSHTQSHKIEEKILACNPILQAFGNSKTIRNDNSSRFGKYVQIYFANDHTIVGANINSYLLQKSRVVTPSEGQRNFHVFYALVKSGTMGLKKVQDYKYLQRSKCFQVPSINDKQYFKEINQSMSNIGFKDSQQKKIWDLLSSILELGNIQFDDTKHKQKESQPCQLRGQSKQNLQKLSNLINVKQSQLQKILLYEKKTFIKQTNYSAYNKNKCISNANTLSKAIYNAIFEFIIYKIHHSLRPKSLESNKYLSINILDIFGFQNFLVNSFEQFCINYTNQKLLRLYNQYVFERQMRILRQDGLDNHIAQIKAPTNQAIIQTISGKMSLFSIIIDYTMPTQFKDADIVAAFQTKIQNATCLQFDKMNKNKFTIIHSQCSVKYEIQGFKQKNQDKVLPEIADIVNNLFQNQSRDQVGKTLLTKFGKQIEDLMQQLTSSSVHFIRCIKPNQKKTPKCVQQKYLLTQVRYLGVFETIQIRKKTFPSRWLYQEFIKRFESLFPISKGSNKQKTQKIMKDLTKDPKDYLLGNQRIYMNSQLQNKLLKKLHQIMKKKVESGKKIWKAYKKYKFRKQILRKLKLLSKRIKIWRKIAQKYKLEAIKAKFNLIKQFYKAKVEQQKLAQQRVLNEQKKARKQQQQKQKNKKIQKRKTQLPKLIKFFDKKIQRNLRSGYQSIKTTLSKKVNKNNVQDNYQSNRMKKIPELNNSSLDESVFIQDPNQPKKYQRQITTKQQKKTNFQMQKSFANQVSILFQHHPDIIFQGSLKVDLFKQDTTPDLKKLKMILSDKYKSDYVEKNDQFLSPPSQDGKFSIQDTPNQLMTRIIQFDSKAFFKKVLRKRTNFFGMSKDEDDILVVKNRPLSKSLTQIQQYDQVQSLKIFKQILKVAEQAKLQSVFKQVQKLIFSCRAGSPQLLNQVLLQLLKQSNTSNQLNSIRVLQAMTVFLHIYSPDQDFLLATLNFIFKKLAEHNYTERQAQYFKYVFKKITRRLNSTPQINFMPIKYQIMALMCKRMISIPVYLPIGSSSHVKVESFQVLGDIKTRVMDQLGINHRRLYPQLFTFFQLTNYQGSSQQRPLDQKLSVWDLVSYWQRSAQKYIEQNQTPPTFYLILKIRFIYQCHQTDQQTIQLMFGQSFYDLFMGRIKLGLKQMAAIAACIKKIKYDNSNDLNDIKNCYPLWVSQKWDQKQVLNQINQALQILEQPQYLQMQNSFNDPQVALKYKFLQICELAPLSLSMTVSTHQDIKLHFKHKKLMISQNSDVQQQIPIKSITRYAEQDNKLVFEVRNSNKTRIIHSDQASICCSYLSLLQELVTNKFSHTKNQYQSITQYQSKSQYQTKNAKILTNI